jgi:hypothetical protein
MLTDSRKSPGPKIRKTPGSEEPEERVSRFGGSVPFLPDSSFGLSTLQFGRAAISLTLSLSQELLSSLRRYSQGNNGAFPIDNSELAVALPHQKTDLLS